MNKLRVNCVHLGKKVYLVANKVDGVHAEAALVEFYKLGMGEPIQVAASHGRGVQQMLEEVLAEVQKMKILKNTIKTQACV